MPTSKLSPTAVDRFRFGVWLVVAGLAVVGSSLQADTLTKADNTDNLNLATSWVQNVAPGPADILLWNSTVTGANTVSLGLPNLLVSTVQINNPGGLVTINGLGTLQLGANGTNVGIDMSSATADLTINSNVALEDSPAAHIWDVAAGRTLTINGNVDENGPSNKTLTINGDGITRITGVIGTGENDLSIEKNGSGMLVISGANLYGGTTTVNQGVLRISNSDALGSNRVAGDVTINAGGELQLLGNISLANGEDLSITGTGAGGPGSAAIHNLAGGNQLNGDIVLQDVVGVVRINSDSLGTLSLLGNITEDGGSDKILAFGGNGTITVSGNIGGGTDILAVTKDGTGTLILSGNNSYRGDTVVREGTLTINGATGDIGDSASVTINNATLTLDNTLANKTDRIGNVPVTMNSGTFNFIHGAQAGPDYSERIDNTLTLNSGASTIRTDVSNTADSSLLRFKTLARGQGATVNFVGGPSAANDDNNVRFDDQAAGLIGAWATVGGTNFATYNTASANDSVEALTTYEQTLTRLSSGTKIISNGGTNNVVVTEGTGTAGDITLGSAITTINTLTNSATGTSRAAGGVTIDPAGQTLQVNGILNGANSTELTIGNGTNNGTLTAKTAGGELIIQNYSSNAVTVNSVIANNSTASSLTTAGTGSIIVTAANTYSGVTIVNQGTLQVSGTAGALANTSSVTVNTSGTLLLSSTTTVRAGGGMINDTAGVTLAGGTIRAGVNGINETVGALTLSNSSVIDFGTLTGTNNLRFGDSTGLWTAGTTLSIINYTGNTDHLFFGTVTGAGVDTGQLGQINFYSDSSLDSFLGTGIYLPDGEVAPVPEPSTWIGGVLAVAAVAFTQRRRLRKVIAIRTRFS